VAELGRRWASPASSVSAPSSLGQACGKSAHDPRPAGGLQQIGLRRLTAAHRGGARFHGHGVVAGGGGVVAGGGGLFAGGGGRAGGDASWLGRRGLDGGGAVVVSGVIKRRQIRGRLGVRAATPRGLGPTRGTGRGIFRATSARARSEARFEVLCRARLRAVFGARWAVPGWTDPT
jgi:hypothetical protein